MVVCRQFYPSYFTTAKSAGQPATDIVDLIPPVPGLVELFKLKARYLVIGKNTQLDSQSESEKNLLAAVFQLEDSGSPEAMQTLIGNLHLWLADRPHLQRSFAHWISKTLLYVHPNTVSYYQKYMIYWS